MVAAIVPVGIQCPPHDHENPVNEEGHAEKQPDTAHRIIYFMVLRDPSVLKSQKLAIITQKNTRINDRSRFQKTRGFLSGTKYRMSLARSIGHGERYRCRAAKSPLLFRSGFISATIQPLRLPINEHP